MSKYHFDEKISRLAGLFAVFFPFSLFYAGVYLKAGILGYIIVAVVYQLHLIQNSAFIKLKNILLLVLLVFFPFLLRTAVGVLLLLTVMVLIINKSRFIKNNPVKLFAIIIITFGTVFIIDQIVQVSFYENMVTSGGDYAEAKLNAIRNEVSLFGVASFPLFAVLSMFAPFPAFVKVDAEGFAHAVDMYYLGGILVWNVLSVFTIIGLFQLIKNGWRN